MESATTQCNNWPRTYTLQTTGWLGRAIGTYKLRILLVVAVLEVVVVDLTAFVAKHLLCVVDVHVLIVVTI